MFTPMCVYGLAMHLVKRLSRDKGPGKGHKVSALATDSLGRGGRGGVSTRYLAPAGGVSNTHIGVNTGLGVPNLVDFSRFSLPSRGQSGQSSPDFSQV